MTKRRSLEELLFLRGQLDELAKHLESSIAATDRRIAKARTAALKKALVHRVGFDSSKIPTGLE